MSWLHSLRTRSRLLFAHRAAESRMDEELALHLELETARLIREEGLDPAEARRRAHATFGGVQRHREALRDGRGLAWLGGLRLDLELGARMLVKYPGLTVIGGLAMAFGIWFGVLTFEVTGLLLRPSLPLPDGDRIVHLWNQDVQANDSDQQALYDFLVWRESLRSVTDLGAWRNDMRNLIGSDGDGRPIFTAEISASAFRIAPDRPHMGRTLLPSDEEPGAPPVVLLGWDVWANHCSGRLDEVVRSDTCVSTRRRALHSATVVHAAISEQSHRAGAYSSDGKLKRGIGCLAPSRSAIDHPMLARRRELSVTETRCFER